MLFDERALLRGLERSAAAEAVHDIVEQLAAAGGAKALIRIHGAIPRHDFPLRTAATRHTFGRRIRFARAECSTVPTILGREREDDLRRAPSLLDRFAAFAAV